jgi:hypothetical protein
MIRQLLDLHDRCERELGRVLARMSDQGAWHRLRFAGLGHYAEQRLGLARTSARDRARLARGLRTLPVVRQAYGDGLLGPAAALCLVRILKEDPPEEEIQREWVERAVLGTVKRLRDECRELERRQGSERFPRSCRQASERPPRTFRQASERFPRTCRPLTDAEWHRSLKRQPGTARRRIAELGQEASTLFFANTVFSVSLPEDLAEAFVRAIEAARRSLLARSGAAAQADPDPRASLVIAGKLAANGHQVPSWVGLLALIEEFVATWDVAQNPRRPSEDAVHIRDGWRCMAPGCTSRRNLQEHHVRYRSQGGSDEIDNRLCLCAFHHQRGEHGGLASCRGVAPLEIEWSLGRGGSGGLFRNEIRVAGLKGWVSGRLR